MNIQRVNNNQQTFGAKIKATKTVLDEAGNLTKIVTNKTSTKEQDLEIIKELISFHDFYGRTGVEAKKSDNLHDLLGKISGVFSNNPAEEKLVLVDGKRLMFGDGGKNPGDVIYEVTGKRFISWLDQMIDHAFWKNVEKIEASNTTKMAG